MPDPVPSSSSSPVKAHQVCAALWAAKPAATVVALIEQLDKDEIEFKFACGRRLSHLVAMQISCDQGRLFQALKGRGDDLKALDADGRSPYAHLNDCYFGRGTALRALASAGVELGDEDRRELQAAELCAQTPHPKLRTFVPKQSSDTLADLFGAEQLAEFVGSLVDQLNRVAAHIEDDHQQWKFGRETRALKEHLESHRRFYDSCGALPSFTFPAGVEMPASSPPQALGPEPTYTELLRQAVAWHDHTDCLSNFLRKQLAEVRRSLGDYHLGLGTGQATELGVDLSADERRELISYVRKTQAYGRSEEGAFSCADFRGSPLMGVKCESGVILETRWLHNMRDESPRLATQYARNVSEAVNTIHVSCVTAVTVVDALKAMLFRTQPKAERNYEQIFRICFYEPSANMLDEAVYKVRSVPEAEKFIELYLAEKRPLPGQGAATLGVNRRNHLKSELLYRAEKNNQDLIPGRFFNKLSVLEIWQAATARAQL